jgi:two-component system sensor histidine kinase SenX3
VSFVLGVVIGVVIATAVLVPVLRSRSDSRIRSVELTASERTNDAVARFENTSSLIRTALDSLTVGVVVASAEGEVLFRNRVASGLTGALHADVLVDEAIDVHLRGALSGENRRQVIELFGPPSRVVLVAAYPIDEGGALATIEDITERSRLDAVRTDFVANISHELKTPVGALAVLAEALADETEPEVIRRLSLKMVEESIRAGRTIDDLLELSRIELGGEALKEAVAVGLVIAEAVDRVRTLADRRGVVLRVVEPGDRLKVLGDRRQIVSALGNLVENAIKYSESGKLVEVSASTDGLNVDMRVRDEGMGIPTRDLDRIFERFYRVDRARSRETGGTGLGLAIVRHVATNHGGDVLVSSVEGEGSTFTLRIPAAPGLAVASPFSEAG